MAIILYCYVCFWIGRKYLKGSLIWIVLNPIIYIGLCIAADRGTWWYNTAFCFAIGELTALYKKQIDKKQRKAEAYGCWLPRRYFWLLNGNTAREFVSFSISVL